MNSYRLIKPVVVAFFLCVWTLVISQQQSFLRVEIHAFYHIDEREKKGVGQT